jgi:cholesterol oxidase
MKNDNDFDYIIIGSGFGGSVSALRLVEKGYSVALIEAGRKLKPENCARKNREVLKYLWSPKLGCYGIMEMTMLSDMFIMRGRGYGGGSLGYANTLLMPPDSFYNDRQWSIMGDWKRNLAQHYSEAKRMLGVSKNEKFTPADDVMRSLAGDFGKADTFHMQDVGVFFGEPDKSVKDPYFGGVGPDRTGCSYCGSCVLGCRSGAKNSLDKNYLYLAGKKGLQVFTERTAILIYETGDGFEVETVSTTSKLNKRKIRFSAKNVIVAAGVLGTLDLLFRSADKGSLKNLPPSLGKKVRTNSEAMTAVRAKDDSVDYSKGLTITSSMFVDDVTHVEPMRSPTGADLMSLMYTVLTGKGSRVTRPLKWLMKFILHPVEFLKLHWPFGTAPRTILLLVMQTVDNSIRIDYSGRWWNPFSKKLKSKPETGMQKAPAYIQQAQDVTVKLAEKVNGTPMNSINEVLFDIGTTGHILGGCAIGPDAENGVVDAACRVYGHNGLYVIDGSVIPANIGVNPSLTITAIAEFAMSLIPPKAETGNQQQIFSDGHAESFQESGV